MSLKSDVCLWLCFAFTFVFMQYNYMIVPDTHEHLCNSVSIILLSLKRVEM